MVAEFGIREASERDIPVLVPLVNRAFEVQDKKITGIERTDADEMLSLMQDGTFLVSEDEKGALGCVYVKLIGTAGYFGMLAVDPSSRRSGGSLLGDRARIDFDPANQTAPEAPGA